MCVLAQRIGTRQTCGLPLARAPHPSPAYAANCV